MKDQRIENLISLIFNYSVGLVPGEIVLLKGIGDGSVPYLKEAYRQCILRGAKYTEIDFVWSEESEVFGLFANNEQTDYFPNHKLDFAKKCDILISFFATDNFVHLANIDPKNGLKRKSSLQPIRKELLKKRWVLTEIPTHGLAQNAKMSLSEFEDFYFSACITDYKKMSAAQN
ncbi:MAG: aminopeptidase, partial [Syntrophales bacterium]|nr:aminopeptidase [Syntrophales bacterium]